MGLATGAWGLRRWQEPYRVTGVHDKLDYWADHRQDFGVLFLGSSMTFHHIIPDVVDQCTADSGLTDLRSFNLGLPSLWVPELTHFSEHVFATPPDGVKWVFIEVVEPKLAAEEVKSSERRVYWHDLPRTLACLSLAFDEASARSWSASLSLSAKHLSLGGEKYFGTGRMALSADTWLRGEKRLKGRKRMIQDLETHRGYRMTDKSEFPKNQEASYLQLVQELRATPDILAPMPKQLYQDLQSMAVAVRHLQAEPVFLLPPSPNLRHNYGPMPPGVRVLALNRPAEYPELYDIQNRFDNYHLNDAGARLYSAIIGKWLTSVAKGPRAH
jgi:hypothetical protein